MNDKKRISAGDFTSWLNHIRQALISRKGIEVSCSDCRACCTSSYFIHIGPDEPKTSAKISKKLLFPAPGLPKGHMLLGYNEKGHCPMYVDGECSIYEFRPQTCRGYDCRIFPATGLNEGRDKPLINEQALKWQFDFPAEQDRECLAAVHNAAKFLKKYPELFPEGFVPRNPSQLAILAIKVYKVFLEETNEHCIKGGEHEGIKKISKAIMDAYKKFEIEFF
jgi:uncharacterized protein